MEGKKEEKRNSTDVSWGDDHVKTRKRQYNPITKTTETEVYRKKYDLIMMTKTIRHIDMSGTLTPNRTPLINVMTSAESENCSCNNIAMTL